MRRSINGNKLALFFMNCLLVLQQEIALHQVMANVGIFCMESLVNVNNPSAPQCFFLNGKRGFKGPRNFIVAF
jgi:hypothetical protein